jgi:hypothetical protein
MINNQNFIFFNIHKSATSVDLNKSNRVATGNRLSRLSRDWSVVYASLISIFSFYLNDFTLLYYSRNNLSVERCSISISFFIVEQFFMTPTACYNSIVSLLHSTFIFRCQVAVEESLGLLRLKWDGKR